MVYTYYKTYQNLLLKGWKGSRIIIMTNRLSGLDGVRACASLMIVIHHLSQNLHIDGQYMSPNTPFIQLICMLTFQTGVTVFFVLSGGLLARPFWKNYFDGKDMPNIKDFFIRRIARLAPGLYAAFFLGIAIEMFVLPDLPDRFLRIITTLTFTAGLHYTTFFPTPINTPIWSVSYEFISYVLLAVSMFGLYSFFKKRVAHSGLIWWLIVLLATFALNQVILTYCQPDDVNRGWQYGLVGGAKYWAPYYNPIAFFAQYMFGIAAAGVTVYFQKNIELYKRYSASGLFDKLSVMGITGYIFLMLLFTYLTAGDYEGEWLYGFQHQPYHYPFFTFFAALTVAFLPLSNKIGKMMDNRFFTFTAKISFGLYIYHFIFLNLVFNLEMPPGTTSVTNWILGCIAVFAATYGLSYISWRFLEEPAIRWSKRFLSL